MDNPLGRLDPLFGVVILLNGYPGTRFWSRKYEKKFLVPIFFWHCCDVKSVCCRTPQENCKWFCGDLLQGFLFL
jgi:hypothetical protein